MEDIVFEVLERYNFEDLKTLKVSIDKYMEYKVKKDIENDNELELCIVPLINYGNIYVSELLLIEKLYNKFPSLMNSEYDERKKYIYIQGNITNIKNQKLIEILIENKYKDDDILICRVPKYLNKYEDIIKYRHIFTEMWSKK